MLEYGLYKHVVKSLVNDTVVKTFQRKEPKLFDSIAVTKRKFLSVKKDYQIISKHKNKDKNRFKIILTEARTQVTKKSKIPNILLGLRFQPLWVFDMWC